jgi:hypothetical protein
MAKESSSTPTFRRRGGILSVRTAGKTSLILIHKRKDRRFRTDMMVLKLCIIVSHKAKGKAICRLMMFRAKARKLLRDKDRARLIYITTTMWVVMTKVLLGTTTAMSKVTLGITISMAKAILGIMISTAKAILGIMISTAKAILGITISMAKAILGIMISMAKVILGIMTSMTRVHPRTTTTHRDKDPGVVISRKLKAVFKAPHTLQMFPCQAHTFR